ncbi:MAG: AbrB/MazE/SpoVT family DNA-binding domain-containing protein [Candidatus Bathyarchaeia archaeon]
MQIKRKLGPKGQIVIPKVVREFLGIEAGDEVIIEVREKEVIIKHETDPEKFVSNFCSLIEKKLKEKVNLEKLLEEEVEERIILH